MSEQYVYGVHAVSALLTNPHRVTKKLYISEDRVDKRLQDIIDKAIQAHINIEKLSTQKMNQRFADFAHQGIVASASLLPDYNESHLLALLEASKQPTLILILDGVTDPHNLGACLRTADATGVDFVVIPKDKSASITPVVSKVACGAAESVPLVRVTNLVRSMKLLKEHGVWIYGAAGEATSSLYQIDCTGDVAIVMGAEGEGLRRLTREHCDGLFSLPMSGSVTSLNVSVATGVSLYEIIRQRKGSGS
ncbi:23S rRNA (guanosine(2251)-2'-O)-methyltransferase RlmB [Legionella qingyii]|uniref:23S rRNA (guanosine-2'-O-)-methyltransferase RlmB n=1 Tax=Legionella qingyii TaxID=2184757 RepID=A0A317U022_9GAMM|nr:23S rRNA (guanosine(2251)-2'-O)-methyltransferase RlmB [Legionella qingyii]PWY54628.1 23S rRNA (guanosine(2251)-2'-O)-methyltransferase RlmB [Legionella qingyii]RUR20466.1 23S rRNA (guanosine(2251)-2'-O)-methyltransferase RlmB [Legionella qingyii]RUR22658.1 23S rRNA (guanosine(2251)-2'-O)-methyltransferase RlmB [Legionella qingyii]